MSKLTFRRRSRQLTLHSRNGLLLGTWYAHNDTASNSRGLWPSGQYDWSYFKPHREEGYFPAAYRTAYGGNGIHIFDVPGRSGMGIHSGRTLGQPGKAGGKTLGCIRVPTDAMETINQTHESDPIDEITVLD